ncbi:MAG: tetratricopeptide repeat protein, partial [Verrucomicrobiales bacterium]
MASKNQLPADGPPQHGGEPEPFVPPVDAITKLELFLEKHWRMVVTVLAVVVTAVIIFFYLKYKREDAMTQSNNAFTAAATRADFEGVVEDHPGTVAAGSALYEIADSQIAEAELDGGQATLEKFVSDYPDHKLRENALLALGGISEKQGDLDKAHDYFQQVIDAGDKTSLVPLATICQTEILVAKGELEKALEIYESFAVNNVGSPFIAKAEERLAAVEAKIDRKAAPVAPVEPAPEEPASADPAPATGTSPTPAIGAGSAAPDG